jgi:hypothetical protein
MGQKYVNSSLLAPRGKTLTLVKNVIRDTLIEICCVAGLCRVVMMSYFLGKDATSVNAFYFVGYSQPLN